MAITKRLVAVAAAAAGLGLAAAARADFPFPTCDSASCADPADFGSYLFLAPGQLPNDFDATNDDAWKYNPVTGMDIPAAWLKTTGRPDTVVAILDSGILWNRRSVARSVWLNVGELPIPPGCDVQDCNGDGFVGIDDFDPTLAVIPDFNANGFRDGQDLIKFYSDGVDGDGNGFVDDIAGWDFHDNDNDAFDDVDYGHGSGEADDQVSEANDGGGLPGLLAELALRAAARERQLRRDRHRVQPGGRLRDRPRRRPHLRGARHAVGAATSTRPRSTTPTARRSR